MSVPGAAGVTVPVLSRPPPAVRRPPRPAVLVLAASGTVFGAAVLVAIAPDRHSTTTTTLFAGVVGALFLAAGLVAHLRSPDNRVGLLMVLTGIGWFAEDLQISSDRLVHTMGLAVSAAASGFLVHLVLAFPDGRLHTRAERVLVAVSYAAVFGIVPVARVFLLGDGRRNLVAVTDLPWIRTVVGYIQIGVAVAVLAVIVRRWVSAGPPTRRVLAPVFLATVVGGTASALDPLLTNGLGPLHFLLNGVFHAALVLLPLAFLAGVWRVRLGRTAVTDLLMRLGQPSPAELRDLLARALGDPSLVIGYWSPQRLAFVDKEGAALDIPPGRALTVVERDGHRVAALVHDPALREDGHVLDAVTAAAALELDNQRLAAEVRAQLAEVRASRARIVAAADEQRRRVERDLHDGAQQQLVVIALTLQMARQRLADHPDPKLAALLDRSASGLDDAIVELRELAHGIHPAVLTDSGLLPAVRALVGRAPVPVELTAGPVPRLPGPVEATAYFVVAEGVTNALKHARARHVRVSLAHSAGTLRVAVDDDGVGGADPDVGSGLLGLLDRVRAVDGELTVEPGAAGGTSVRASLPTR